MENKQAVILLGQLETQLANNQSRGREDVRYKLLKAKVKLNQITVRAIRTLTSEKNFWQNALEQIVILLEYILENHSKNGMFERPKGITALWKWAKLAKKIIDTVLNII